MVYNALIDPKMENDFSSLSDKEMFFHLHIAKIHHGVSAAKSQDITTMMHEVVKDGIEEKKLEMRNAKPVYEDAVKQALAKLGVGSPNDHDKLRTVLMMQCSKKRRRRYKIL